MQHLISLSIFVVIVFATNLYIPNLAGSAEYFIQQDKTSKLMELLKFPDKENEIGEKWDEFLKKRTRRFSNEDYQMAIHELKTEYDQSYEMLNICIKNTNKISEEYSSSWAKNFQQRFGKEYIQKNFDSIRFVMIALSMTNSTAACEEQEKEALYREYRHLDAARNYVEYIEDFYRTLDEEDKKKIEHTKSIAESYLKNFEFPLQSTLSKESLNNALYSFALTRQNNLDPQLIEFFSDQPLFRKPFALGKALDDLKAFQKR